MQSPARPTKDREPRPVRRSLFALLGLAASLLLGAAPAGAAPAWLASPQKLSAPGRDALEPQVALDEKGDAVAIWARRAGEQSTSPLVVESAARAAGAERWSAPLTLSDPGQSAFAPQIAVDPRGDAVAVWVRLDGPAPTGREIVEGASLPAGATRWSAPQRLSEPGQNASGLDVAIDPAGNAVAVWRREDGATPTSHRIVESAKLAAGAAQWSATRKLSEPGQDAIEPRVALDPAGNAVAVWARSDGAHLVVESAGLPAGASGWTAPRKVSEAGQDAGEPDVAVDGSGVARAVWVRDSGAQPSRELVESAVLAAGASAWSKPEKVSEAGRDGAAPRLDLGDRGDAVAVWKGLDRTRPGDVPATVEGAVLRVGAAGWSAPQRLSAPGRNAGQPQIAVGADGDAVAIWEGTDAAGTLVESAALLRGAAAWSQPQALSAPGGEASEPQLAVDAAGDALAAWERIDGTAPGAHSIVEGNLYDASAPALSVLDVPKSGFVGQRLSFSASATDLFSAVALRWSFGDRGSAGGARATHTFRRPGRYRVGVDAVDAVANAATGTASVDVWQLAVSGAKLAHGTALLRVRCLGAGTCRGRLALAAARVPAPLGKVRFSLAAGRSRTLRVKLSAKAKRLLDTAPRRGVTVRASGAGVKGTALRLRPRTG